MREVFISYPEKTVAQQFNWIFKERGDHFQIVDKTSGAHLIASMDHLAMSWKRAIFAQNDIADKKHKTDRKGNWIIQPTNSSTAIKLVNQKFNEFLCSESYNFENVSDTPYTATKYQEGECDWILVH